MLLLLHSGASWAQGFAPRKNTLWTKLGYVVSGGDQIFAGLDEVRFDSKNSAGDRVPFYNVGGTLVRGALQIHEVGLTTVYSPLKDFSLALQAPLLKYVHYANETMPFSTEAAGLGDINLGAAYQWSPGSWRRFGSSLQALVKLPTTGNYPYTNQAILGDGQVDVGLASLNTVVAGPLYVNFSVLLNYRMPYEDNARSLDIGNELRLDLSVGGAPMDGVWLTLGYQGSFAEAWVLEEEGAGKMALILPSLHQLFASAYISLFSMNKHQLALDVWFRAPMVGQDLPVLYAGGLGLAWAADFNDG